MKSWGGDAEDEVGGELSRRRKERGAWKVGHAGKVQEGQVQKKVNRERGGVAGVERVVRVMLWRKRMMVIGVLLVLISLFNPAHHGGAWLHKMGFREPAVDSQLGQEKPHINPFGPGRGSGPARGGGGGGRGGMVRPR